MIVEQAFIALPELLLGNTYSVQDYEAGIIGVLSLAILQELNGRNAVHPIRHLHAERRYRVGSHRRADLCVNLRRLLISNTNLAHYGWRHENWIEAKFYRNKTTVQRHATNKSAYQGQLISDLIRLTCLVPLTLGKRDSSGRYFLHVYDDEPRYYLAYKDRPWVRSLHTAGRQDLVIDTLAAESQTAKAKFGEALVGLIIQATVTNFVNFPITTEGGDRHYWCVLSRFDAFSVRHDGRSFFIHLNRVTGEGNPGEYAAIAAMVGEHLGFVKKSEEQR